MAPSSRLLQSLIVMCLSQLCLLLSACLFGDRLHGPLSLALASSLVSMLTPRLLCTVASLERPRLLLLAYLNVP